MSPLFLGGSPANNLLRVCAPSFQGATEGEEGENKPKRGKKVPPNLEGAPIPDGRNTPLLANPRGEWEKLSKGGRELLKRCGITPNIREKKKLDGDISSALVYMVKKNELG